MRADASVINGLSPEAVGLDPLSQVTSELVADLRKLQAMGLDLSELVKEEPKKSKSEQARINGSKSKGPVTEAGKAASSQNALKHGLCAKGVLLPGEDPAAFESFASDFCQELKPLGTLQKMLVSRAAELAWKLQRLPALEGAILESARVNQERYEDEEDEEDEHGAGGIGDLLHQLVGREGDGVLMRLQRYETRIERSLQGCLRELRLVKKDMAGAVGSFGAPSHAHGQLSVGLREAATVDEAALPARGPSAARQDDGFAGVRLGLGSFRTEMVGSFGAPSHAHGQPSVGLREKSMVVGEAPPARGPSAARQDDGFTGVRLGLGSFGTGAVGSFRTETVGSFKTDAVGSFGR